MEKSNPAQAKPDFLRAGSHLTKKNSCTYRHKMEIAKLSIGRFDLTSQSDGLEAVITLLPDRLLSVSKIIPIYFTFCKRKQ